MIQFHSVQDKQIHGSHMPPQLHLMMSATSHQRQRDSGAQFSTGQQNRNR